MFTLCGVVTETFLGDTTQHRELAKGGHETSRYLDKFNTIFLVEGFGPCSGPKASKIFKLHLPATFITSIGGPLSFIHFGVEKVN